MTNISNKFEVYEWFSPPSVLIPDASILSIKIESSQEAHCPPGQGAHSSDGLSSLTTYNKI